MMDIRKIDINQANTQLKQGIERLNYATIEKGESSYLNRVGSENYDIFLSELTAEVTSLTDRYQNLLTTMRNIDHVTNRVRTNQLLKNLNYIDAQASISDKLAKLMAIMLLQLTDKVNKEQNLIIELNKIVGIYTSLLPLITKLLRFEGRITTNKIFAYRVFATHRQLTKLFDYFCHQLASSNPCDAAGIAKKEASISELIETRHNVWYAEVSMLSKLKSLEQLDHESQSVLLINYLMILGKLSQHSAAVRSDYENAIGYSMLIINSLGELKAKQVKSDEQLINWLYHAYLSSLAYFQLKMRIPLSEVEKTIASAINYYEVCNQHTSKPENYLILACLKLAQEHQKSGSYSQADYYAAIAIRADAAKDAINQQTQAASVHQVDTQDQLAPTLSYSETSSKYITHFCRVNNKDDEEKVLTLLFEQIDQFRADLKASHIAKISQLLDAKLNKNVMSYQLDQEKLTIIINAQGFVFKAASTAMVTEHTDTTLTCICNNMMQIQLGELQTFINALMLAYNRFASDKLKAEKKLHLSDENTQKIEPESAQEQPVLTPSEDNQAEASPREERKGKKAAKGKNTRRDRKQEKKTKKAIEKVNVIPSSQKEEIKPFYTPKEIGIIMTPAVEKLLAGHVLYPIYNGDQIPFGNLFGIYDPSKTDWPAEVHDKNIAILKRGNNLGVEGTNIVKISFFKPHKKSSIHQKFKIAASKADPRMWADNPFVCACENGKSVRIVVFNQPVDTHKEQKRVYKGLNKGK